MASSVAANGSPLSIHWNGSRDVRNASKVGEPENIVPASSVVKQVSTKRTMFQTGPRERRRGGAAGRGTVWPLVGVNGSAASGRSVMSSAYHAAVRAAGGVAARARRGGWLRCFWNEAVDGEAGLRDRWRVLVDVRGVREGAREQAEIDEAMVERRLQRGEIEGRHGSAGARRALGELGGHLGAPVCWREIEARHGSAGARRALGGLGHLGAPHVLARERGAPRLRRGATGA